MSSNKLEKQEKEWVLWEPEDEGWRELASAFDLHPVVARILYQRGFRDLEVTERYLEPSLRHMADPFLMKDMKRAMREVLRAIERGDHILVHGDYDVDGVSSVAVLFGFLTDLGAKVDYYVPRREQDGYGLSADSVRRFHEEGYGLIVTTDCGISNVEEIKLARELGMRVVIVDHHTIPPELPPANAILNPLQVDCNYPFKELAAVGVTFNLVVAIRSELRKRGIFRSIPEPDLRRYLDLVALGTVADVMPLVDQNRIYVRAGLEVLAKRRRAGIAALMERAQIEVGPVTARTISYRLAPRINAAGRMDDASICVELLTTRSYARATKLAAMLEEFNTSRQAEERGILDDALAQAERQAQNDRRILMVSGHSWHRGVLGIVASRLMEQFHRPAILMGVENGMAKGSARSIKGINVVDVLTQADEFLATYGGHSLAAGLTLREEFMEQFHERVDRAVASILNDGPLPRPTLDLASRVEIGEIDQKLLDDLKRLGPFGSGNPEPILLCERAEASSVKVVGRGHLRAKLRSGSSVLDAFGFSMASQAGLAESLPLAIAFTAREIRKRGRVRLELQIRGLRAAEESVPDSRRTSRREDKIA